MSNSHLPFFFYGLMVDSGQRVEFATAAALAFLEFAGRVVMASPRGGGHCYGQRKWKIATLLRREVEGPCEGTHWLRHDWEEKQDFVTCPLLRVVKVSSW